MKPVKPEQTAILANRPALIGHDSLWYRIRSNRLAYLFILPWFLLFSCFTIYPLLYSFYISFTNFNPLKPSSTSEFAGLSNYIDLLTDTNFHVALKNTLVFAVGTIPFTTIIALLLAVALNQGVKFKTLYRIGFFFPAVTSITVIATLFRLIFFNDGLLTKLVSALGFEGKNWLSNSQTALPCIMAMCVWSAIGFYMILYLSALQTIPAELYEAAVVDGATPVKKFFYVTLPHLRQITLYVIIVNTINSLQIFTEPQVMTQGGPAFATTTGVLYLYRVGFTSHRMGYASAVGYALFFIILIFTLIQMKLMGLEKGVDD